MKAAAPVSIFVTLLILSLVQLAGAQPHRLGEEMRVNLETGDDQLLPGIAGLPGGGFVVVWESWAQDGSQYGVFLRRMSNDGLMVGPDVQVNTYTTGSQVDASVAVSADGSFLVVWDDDTQDGDGRGIYGQLFDADGEKVGAELAINSTPTGDQNDAVAAPQPGGGFVVVWESETAGDPANEDLVAGRFDAAGALIDSEFDVNQTIPGDQEDAAVATDAAGNFVVAWESENVDGSLDSVLVRRFDATGTPLGDELQVNVFTQGDQANPQLAVAADGSFVVVWEDDTVALPDDTVHARFYDAAGAPATAPQQVEIFGNGLQILPAVALDGDGRALVVWQSLGQDGSDGGVYMRSMNPDGSFFTNEIPLNTFFAGHQVEAKVAVDGLGRVLTAWLSEAQDGSLAGIYSQRFTTAFFYDGFESGDLAGWTASGP